ncbi:MAG: hypothetical protein LUE22_01560 [Oscillospiraceae bacterium]|nr:hypothetical protein [Oscillospiraceae bacterium]
MKSKRTKALEISPETKHRVYMRDGCHCVWCGSTDALPEAHYIRRSWGGLGVEENILTLCRACHYRFDSGPAQEREEMTEFFRRYLKGIYGEDWDEEKLYYGRTK